MGGLGPSSLGVTKWETEITHRHITNEKKYEGFGGRPPVGGRPVARALWARLKSGPDSGYLRVRHILLDLSRVVDITKRVFLREYDTNETSTTVSFENNTCDDGFACTHRTQVEIFGQMFKFRVSTVGFEESVRVRMGIGIGLG